jgi:hypothetical protein
MCPGGKPPFVSSSRRAVLPRGHRLVRAVPRRWRDALRRVRSSSLVARLPRFLHRGASPFAVVVLGHGSAVTKSGRTTPI